MFASCLVRCTAPPVDFADQLPLLRLFSATGRGFLMEVALYQVSTLYPFYDSASVSSTVVVCHTVVVQ